MSNQSNNPPQPTSTMIALYNFDAEDEPEISMKKGDRIEMLDMDPALNGWAYARKKGDGIEGYVPISYLGTSVPSNSNSNRPHKHSKAGNNESRSTSPLSNKSRYDNRNNFRNNNNFASNNNPQNQNQNTAQNESESNHQQQHSNNAQNNINNGQNHNQNNNQNKQNNQSHSHNDIPDTKQIICSFHRDFIPEMNDLYKYFGEFGKITNKLEIEYDNKKVPLAKIKFQSAACVDKVCDKGNRQQIPSGAQNGTIHIRVYRSMQDYLSNTQRSRGHSAYNKHKNSRRGGF